jgi:choline dehydrogenase-like flavoprotein
MRGLPSVERSRRFRTRRFDAVVLGGALPGLIAAVRLGMSGARVLVVEEQAARDAFPGIRDPFLVTGGDPSSVLGRCLRDLGIPLIERQRIGSDPQAYQVVFPEARIDMGERKRVRSELVTWGYASPSTATSLVRGLADASAAEREAMLEASVVRSPSRRNPRRRSALTANTRAGCPSR